MSEYQKKMYVEDSKCLAYAKNCRFLKIDIISKTIKKELEICVNLVDYSSS